MMLVSAGRGRSECQRSKIGIPKNPTCQNALPIAKVEIWLHLEVADRPEADRDEKQQRNQKEGPTARLEAAWIKISEKRVGRLVMLDPMAL